MRRIALVSILLPLGFASLHGQQTNDPVDFNKILVNHVGFTPQAAKYCRIAGNTAVAFEVIDTATGQAAFAGRTTPGGPDLGSFQVGDFSALTRSGTFQVRAGDRRSGSFVIASDTYEDALRKTVSYFAKQRCGPSETGYHAPWLARSAFGIAPFGLFSKNTGGDRRAGDYWYRYFMEPGSRWWVGINANLASTGVGLAKAARLLKEPRLAALAQQQLDWILGVNPFDASTMTGVGRNQPRQFVTGEFKPVTPLIDGAVMNGIGGTPDDQPDLKPGSWQTCEYWTPMVCYTMWLMSELSAK